MLRDTEDSFRTVPAARAEFVATLRTPDRTDLETRVSTVRRALSPQDADIDIPGRDPNAGR